jgi:chemotaxis protein histidine kinase CheA
MDDSKQQIIHYFIEEAQEHLDTVEHGLLDLGEVIKDADRVNELFRAAHSVKGGAAMLGFDSIQKTSHELEDCFKILRDHSIPVDRQLESMFLKGYDALKELVAELAGSPTLTLRPEVVEPIVQNSLVNFAELKEYLNELLGMATIDAPLPIAQAARANVAAVNSNTAVMAPPVNLSAKVMDNLKAMLSSFKQGEAAASRPQIASYCQTLAHLDVNTATWQYILKISAQAIGNSANAYEALAPVVIKELKLAGDLLAAGRGQEIAASPALQALAIATVPVAAPVQAAPAQLSIPLDARGAAQLILRNFSRQQISDMITLLHRAINQPKQN